VVNISFVGYLTFPLYVLNAGKKTGRRNPSFFVHKKKPPRAKVT